MRRRGGPFKDAGLGASYIFMKKTILALLLALAAAPAFADGPFKFADGRSIVVNRTARPRTATFYGPNYEILKEESVEAKETGILTVLEAGNLASLAYTGPEGKRLAVWNSRGKRIADLPVSTLVAEIALEDGKILAGDPKTGHTVLDRKGAVLETRLPTRPDATEKELYQERKKKR